MSRGVQLRGLAAAATLVVSGACTREESASPEAPVIARQDAPDGGAPALIEEAFRQSLIGPLEVPGDNLRTLVELFPGPFEGLLPPRAPLIRPSMLEPEEVIRRHALDAPLFRSPPR